MRTKAQVMQEYRDICDELNAANQAVVAVEGFEEFNEQRMRIDKIDLRMRCLSQELSIMMTIEQEALRAVAPEATDAEVVKE